MKAKERRHLKQNEFAETAGRLAQQLREHQNRVIAAVATLVVLAAIVGGFSLWRRNQSDKAGTLLGHAYVVAQSTISPASTLPGAAQPPGTFPSEAARAEATIKAFQEVVTRYPSSNAAVAAAYEIAATQLEQGQYAEAEAGFTKVVDEHREPYSSTARLGLAHALLASGKTDAAIKLLTDLSAERDGPLPVDGVLVQLARANAQAGKTADARAAYKRVVDEFSDSLYAADARQALATLN
jgi:TolA-binding protein